MKRRTISTNTTTPDAKRGGLVPSPHQSVTRSVGLIDQPGLLRQGLVELALGLLLGDADGERQLADEDLAGFGEHPLLARRQALVLLPDRQVPHDFGDLVDVAALQLLDVV